MNLEQLHVCEQCRQERHPRAAAEVSMSTDLQTRQDSSPSIQPALKASLAESTQASTVYNYVLFHKHCSARAQSTSTGLSAGDTDGSSTVGEGVGAWQG